MMTDAHVQRHALGCTTNEMRDIFIAHLDRLRAGYKVRAADCEAAYQAADATADAWTAGLERGLSMAYRMAETDIAEAIKTEQHLYRIIANKAVI